MRYSDDIIEEVRMKNDIVDVISQYVKLTRKGNSYFGLCPFHNEKTGSFSVTPSRQMYYCFGCGAGGNVFSFVMEYENFTFGEALKSLADRAGVELPKIEYSKEAREKAEKRAKMLEINKQAAQYFYYQLRRENGAQAWQYLVNRGLSEETIRSFGLGYSDKYSDALYRFLKSKDYTDEQLRESGLFNVDERRGMYDKFWNRVIFPIMDVNNKVIGFGGRVMGDGMPKYLNSPETMIFDKGRNLYGLNIARTTRKPYLILCEGYMDVISMHQAGFTNAVASLGTALTSGHASLIKRYTQEVLLIYDSDAAGIKAALRAIPILRDAGVNSRVVSLKPYKDPDEFIKALGAEAFEQRLGEAMDSFMFRVQISEDNYPMAEPQGANRFFENCAAMLLELSDELERNLYVEAIVKKYRQYGISSEDLKKRVRALAMKGTPAEQRRESRPVPSGGAKPEFKKKESAADKAQKLMLTWMVTYPKTFSTVEKYLTPEDFVVPLYREVAEMLFEQRKNGDVNPARLLNAFTDSEEQREVASLFNATIHLETAAEQNRAFSDTLLRIKEESLKEKNKNWDPADMQGLQDIIRRKKELEDLGRKRSQMQISFE
ncbi:MAG: DNA primase [Clostridiales bacterium]|nr:DNA primase [Candidatus Blautia equi]